MNPPRVLALTCARPFRCADAKAAALLREVGADPFTPSPGLPGLEVSWEEVLEFDPQVVLLCLDPTAEAFGPDDWMRIEGWNRVEAARQGKIFSVPGLFSAPAAAGPEAVRAALKAFLEP